MKITKHAFNPPTSLRLHVTIIGSESLFPSERIHREMQVRVKESNAC